MIAMQGQKWRIKTKWYMQRKNISRMDKWKENEKNVQIFEHGAITLITNIK